MTKDQWDKLYERYGAYSMAWVRSALAQKKERDRLEMAEAEKRKKRIREIDNGNLLLWDANSNDWVVPGQDGYDELYKKLVGEPPRKERQKNKRPQWLSVVE